MTAGAMSDEDTGILQGPRRQSKGKGRASSASNPPASPSRAPPTPGASHNRLETTVRGLIQKLSDKDPKITLTRVFTARN